MNIYSTIQQEATNALKKGDKVERIVYQTILTALKNKAIDLKADSLTDEQSQEVLSKLYKQNTESLLACPMNRRNWLNKLLIEKEILIKFLPQQLTDEEIKKIIVSVLSSLGISNPTLKNKGAIMKVLMPQVKGKADGKKVSEILSTFFN